MKCAPTPLETETNGSWKGEAVFDEGYINITLYFMQEVDYEKIAVALNGNGGYGKLKRWRVECFGSKGKALCYSGSATRLETEMDGFGGDLRLLQDELGVPDGKWRAEVAYESYEGASEDGALVQFEIRDGKLCDWKQSVVTMEEATPWFGFELEHDGAKVIPSKRYEEEVVEPMLAAMLPPLHRACNKLLRRYGFDSVPQDKWVCMVDADELGKVAAFRDACIDLMREAGLLVEPDGSDF